MKSRRESLRSVHEGVVRGRPIRALNGAGSAWSWACWPSSSPSIPFARRLGTCTVLRGLGNLRFSGSYLGRRDLETKAERREATESLLNPEMRFTEEVRRRRDGSTPRVGRRRRSPGVAITRWLSARVARGSLRSPSDLSRYFFARLGILGSWIAFCRRSGRRWEAAMAHPGTPAAAVVLSDDERETLERWARRPTTAQALALRCRIVLACAEGGSNTEIAERLG